MIFLHRYYGKRIKKNHSNYCRSLRPQIFGYVFGVSAKVLRGEIVKGGAFRPSSVIAPRPPSLQPPLNSLNRRLAFWLSSDYCGTSKLKTRWFVISKNITFVLLCTNFVGGFGNILIGYFCNAGTRLLRHVCYLYNARLLSRGLFVWISSKKFGANSTSSGTDRRFCSDEVTNRNVVCETNILSLIYLLFICLAKSH